MQSEDTVFANLEIAGTEGAQKNICLYHSAIIQTSFIDGMNSVFTLTSPFTYSAQRNTLLQTDKWIYIVMTLQRSGF